MRAGSRLKRFFTILALLVLLSGLVFGYVLHHHRQELRRAKEQLNVLLSGRYDNPSYEANGMILVDLKQNEVFQSKNENERYLPASLAKLYVIAYADTLASKDATVIISPEVLSLVPANSSTANLEEMSYPLEELYAAMLIPSGNDAAYAVADYCGGLLDTNAGSTMERIDIFLNHLNGYLEKNNISSTKVFDPSGFDENSYTTASDLAKITQMLLNKSWFREMVSEFEHTISLPNGQIQVWQNTNQYLNPNSIYYNEQVKGIKTGSLEDCYNLIALYEQFGKEFLIVSLGSTSNTLRYEDMNYIFDAIDGATSLK